MAVCPLFRTPGINGLTNIGMPVLGQWPEIRDVFVVLTISLCSYYYGN